MWTCDLYRTGTHQPGSHHQRCPVLCHAARHHPLTHPRRQLTQEALQQVRPSLHAADPKMKILLPPLTFLTNLSVPQRVLWREPEPVPFHQSAEQTEHQHPAPLFLSGGTDPQHLNARTQRHAQMHALTWVHTDTHTRMQARTQDQQDFWFWWDCI